MLARDGGQYATLVEDPNTDPVIVLIPRTGTSHSRSRRW